MKGVLTKACSKEVYYTLNHELEFKIETIQKCKLLGKVIGKALFDHIPLNFSLSHPSLKQMLGKKIELSDIKTLDHQVYLKLTKNPISCIAIRFLDFPFGY